MKAAKLATTGTLPLAARPAATPAMLLSAMPTLKKRSGWSCPNHSVRVELLTSPSTTTMRSFFLPSSRSAWPNASRVAAPSFSSYFTPAFASVTVICSVLQLGERPWQVLFGHRPPVIGPVRLHEGDALPLHRVSDDRLGATLDAARLLERSNDGPHVVPVYLFDVPLERAQLIGQRAIVEHALQQV